MATLRSRQAIIGCTAFIVLLFIVYHDRLISSVPSISITASKYVSSSSSSSPTTSSSTKLKPLGWTISKHETQPIPLHAEKPPGVSKVMGLAFFGRRHTVSILDCYLKRNLVANGGALDGVIWVQRTTDEVDLALLDKLIASEPAYERWTVESEDGGDSDLGDFATSYTRVEDDVLYIKIDDDIVFFEDSTIPSLIETKIRHPELYTVSANVVNQPMISWMHWNLGAVQPYLPELRDATDQPADANDDDDNNGHQQRSPFDWRPSQLPPWHGPSNFTWDKWTPPADQTHRWLRVTVDGDGDGHSINNDSLGATPITHTAYDPWGKGWSDWQIGAQQHYSFLEHLEREDLSPYRFPMWDFQFQRVGIQFIAIQGRDINLAKPIPRDDENHFSVDMPKKLGRHAVADGRGLAVHYSFFIQAGAKGMDSTDVLARYRAFAQENICRDPMLWTPEE